MIHAVYYKWFEKGDWSPTFTRYINIKDGNLKRAARVVAKEFGKLKGSFNIEDDEIDFRVDGGDVFYWVCIKPIHAEDV